MDIDLSIGWRTAPGQHPARRDRRPARAGLDGGDHGDGEPAEHADLAELTGQLLALNPRALAGYPPGIRIIVRRERPHPIPSSR